MQNKDELFKMRHSAEHVLHQAVKELYPQIFLAMGPATDTGFYFDFDSSPEGKEAVSITEADFRKIEKRMQEIINKDLPITREEISVEEAKSLFGDNPYKLVWIDEAEKRGDSISIYWTGKPNEKGSMVDLCAGPHADSTGAIKSFKLLSVAGAYWRGNEKNKMLTRIYGTAFFTKEELDAYLKMLEEARKRDHKKLGVELDLFTFSPLVGSGLALWTPKGTILRTILDDYIWQLRKAKGYNKVEIPHITRKELYEKSGHWEKFKDELFQMKTREGDIFVMKPMNCPHHTQIFASKPRSYRDMPHRYANTTMVYRDEQSGELSGLSRVRCITQDDAHVFCREDQVKEEILKIWDIVHSFYSTFGFDLKLRLSFHDPKCPDKYLGDKEVWIRSENLLREIAEEKGFEYEVAVGEAAFYGPKLDFMGSDALGRKHQVATIQLDRNMPKRFDLEYTNTQGTGETPVMIHAAIMGSIERFLSVLIEHYGGAFPLWLAPVQISLLPIGEDHVLFANEAASMLRKNDIRVEVDENAKSIGAKIRQHTLQKVPYMGIIGDKEIESKSISVRSRDGKDHGVMTIDMLTKKFVTDIENHT